MVKVLIVGDVLSQFRALVEKIDALHKSAHGPFDVVLVAGDFVIKKENCMCFIDYNMQCKLHVGIRDSSLPLYPSKHILN